MKIKKFILVLTVIALFGLVGCTPTAYPDDKKVTVTLAEFEKIQNGMTLAEVEKIIGGPCTMNSELGEKGTALYTVSYGCNGEGTIGANAMFMYQAGKLMTKSQAGLK